jgi:hypothetical protein
MPAMTLRTGTTVRLKKQPAHYPAFVVMGCQGDRVWIRQPDWPTHLQLCVNCHSDRHSQHRPRYPLGVHQSGRGSWETSGGWLSRPGQTWNK